MAFKDDINTLAWKLALYKKYKSKIINYYNLIK